MSTTRLWATLYNSKILVLKLGKAAWPYIKSSTFTLGDNNSGNNKKALRNS